MTAAWTPEREAEVRARLAGSTLLASAVPLQSYRDVQADLAACLAELDRVREERDGMRARVLGYAAELEACAGHRLSLQAIARRLRELVGP